MVTGLAAAAAAVPVVSSAWPAREVSVDAGALRDKMLRSDRVQHQGNAESVGRLALPELPKLASVTALLTGTTQVRTWYAGPDSYRFAVVSTAGEQDLYHSADIETHWDYVQSTFTDTDADLPLRLPRAGDLLPPDLARRILATSAGDTVTGIPAKRVGGVSAAGLRLVPADPDTSIGHVDMWADPDSGLPVQVEINAKGSAQPVVLSRFLDYSLGPPPASALAYDPGPELPARMLATPDVAAVLATAGLVRLPLVLAGRQQRVNAQLSLPGVGLYGTGLSSFVALQLPRGLVNSAVDAATKAGAQEVDNIVQLTIPPVSLALLRRTAARRTYLLTGLVSAEVLQQAARQLAVQPPRSSR
ncbi:hypothetical protein GCM10029964_077110 [Kibdelosporangium lantanae]